MELSIFYAHVRQAAEQQKKPIADLLKTVREMGYTMAEVDFDSLIQEPSIVETLHAVDMEISSIYCFFRFEQEPQHERIQMLVRTASQAGVKRIMPIPGFYQSEDEAGQAAERERMLASMRELVELAGEAGLMVTIEDYDHAMSPIRDSQGMRFFLDHLQTLRATLDTGNFHFASEDVLAAFEALKERVAHVHLKDRTLVETYGKANLTTLDGTRLCPCPIGKGDVPIKQILERLKAIGYDGVLTVEHFGCSDLVSAMRDSAAFVRSFFPQL